MGAMMTKRGKLRSHMWRIMALLIAGLFAVLPARDAWAELPYGTWYYDENLEDWQRIQAVYVPGEAISHSFQEPVDLAIADNGSAYVVDRAANRVVAFSTSGDREAIRQFGDEEGPGKLTAPEGVFVRPDGSVYVADAGNQRIVVFAPDGTVLREYGKPDTPYLHDEFYFVPSKLAVDRRGGMYVVIKGSDQGVLRLGANGEFRGFFAPNKAQQSYINWLKKLVLNKEQLAKEVANRPRPVANIQIDSDGFLFTASPGIGTSGNIRKLNAGGVDAFANRSLQNSQGIVDVASDADGFLYGVDTETGLITVYGPSGNELFAFGSLDPATQRFGVLGLPTAIAVAPGGEIWVADSKLNQIQTFVRTAFGDTVLHALALYEQGKYAESKAYWEQIRQLNDMYDPAFQGLGKAMLNENQFGEALEHFRISYNTEGYSEAFWDVRLQWLQANFILLVLVLAGGIIAARYPLRWGKRYLYSRAWPPRTTVIMQDIRTLGYVLIHPYHGFYRLKERKVPLLLLLGIVVALLVIKAMRLYWTGFIFHPVDTDEINPVTSLLLFIAPLLTWTVASYLISSIRKGEAKFREVLQGSLYAMSPYLFFSLVILVLSNILVLEEAILVQSLERLMLLWIAAMFFVSTQVLNNFEFLETLANLLIMICALFLLWFLLFVVSGLTFNLFDFVHQLYREVASL